MQTETFQKKMKHFFALKRRFVLALTIGASTIGASSAAFAGDTLQDGVLQVGSDLTYPPYNYFDNNNKPAGFDVEFMQAIAQKAGLSLRVQDTRFENLILGVNGRQFDVIASTLYVNPERAKAIHYIPYMKTGVSIAVNSASGNAFTRPEELCGKKVGSIKGGAWIAELHKLAETACKGNPIDVREFPTSPEVTQALLANGIDAQMEDSAVLQNAANMLRGRIKISSKENFYPVVVGLGLQKGQDNLKATLEKALHALEADGSYDALLKKYNVSKPTAAEFAQAIKE
jgi:polar amino acid transport system substrate-binding protein